MRDLLKIREIPRCVRDDVGGHIMLHLRYAKERGRSINTWLDSYHSFSFADYFDPAFMGFCSLRVINEDYIKGGAGFGRHPHKNMEIITYVVEGAIAHQDSLGTGSIIRPGEIQRMRAGTGIMHSEFNHSDTEPLHLLQIWILPDTQNLKPSYEQKTIQRARNAFILIGAPEGNQDRVHIHQDVFLYAAYLDKDLTLSYSFQPGRSGWLQLIKGALSVNNEYLTAGDGLRIEDEQAIVLTCMEDAECLFFDMKGV